MNEITSLSDLTCLSPNRVGTDESNSEKKAKSKGYLLMPTNSFVGHYLKVDTILSDLKIRLLSQAKNHIKKMREVHCDQKGNTARKSSN